MAADSDGLGSAGGGGGGGTCGVVMTCEGDLRDPRFPARLRRLLRELRSLLAEPHPHTLKVNKVEPWNSVRVTLSVPRAAAARLRALAAAGAPQLRALGILSVQLDGDAAVSLRLQHGAELTINTTPDDASTSRSQPNPEILAGLGGIGRLLSEGESSTSTAGTSTSTETNNFKSPNTVCPRDGKIPQNIPTPTTDRCEFPFGSMTQARVIHRKENTLGLGGSSSSIRPPTDAQFVRPSTSTFPAPPPPYPASASPAAPAASGGSPAGGSGQPVALSSPLLVNLLQNDAPAPQPRAKLPPHPPLQHPAKLDRLDDGQVELAVGRAPFEYRAPRPPAPRMSPSGAPPSPSPPSPMAAPPSPLPPPRAVPLRPAPFVRRAFPPTRPGPPVATYRAPNATVIGRRFPSPGFSSEQFAAPPPPPYRQQAPRPRLPPAQTRVTPEDLQALLPPSTTSMDQKTQSSYQEFQRYQQQYNARQRAASRAATQPDWNEPYRDTLGLSLPDLPDNCDLDQLLPSLGADLNLDDTALSAISDLDPNNKLDLLYDHPAQDSNNTDSGQTPDALLQEITRLTSMNGPYESTSQTSEVPSKSDSFVSSESIMPPPPVPVQSTSKGLQASPNHTSNAPFKSPPNATFSPSNMSSERMNASQCMPPPMRLPVRATSSVATATVGSQATAQEIEEQSKQYLIKTLMRDDDIPRKEEKKAEEVTVAQCKLKDGIQSVHDAPEVFGIAKSTIEDDSKKSDDEKRKLLKKDDKLIAQKGGKPRTTGAKEKPATLKDRIVRDVKTKVALSRPQTAKPPTPGEAPKSPGEKESIKLRLKLDKHEPVVQPVYKADVSFVNQPPKGEKSTEGELRVPPLHIKLRGQSAVIKNSKKEKKKLSPGELHKKIKNRKSSESEDKPHRRDSEESASKSSDSTDTKTDEYLHVKSIKLNNHYTEGEMIKTEITGDNNVVYRMKTISKNAHIVTKSEYKINNKISLDKLKKKKLLGDMKMEKDREKEWRNDMLDKEGKYAQNEGYRETNNHEMKKKLPVKEKCDKTSDGKSVQSDADSESVSGASEDTDSRVKCERTLSAEGAEGAMVEARRGSEDSKLKRTAEGALTSPNGILSSEKKRKTSHSSCPDPPGSTNVGTVVGRSESPPAASSQRAGAASPRRTHRPKDKSYCKLVAERVARNERPEGEKFPNRSPTSQAQGEDSGIESMDALSEKSPNQASQSPPGPQRKERLDMPRSTSPTSVQRIIGVIEQPPARDELLERLSLTGQARYDSGPPDIDDIEAELAKMHADHVNGDDAPRRPPPDTKDREPTPIMRDDKQIDRVDQDNSEVKTEDTRHEDKPSSPKKEKDDFDLPSRVSPPLYTYSNPEKNNASDEPKEEKAAVAENGDAKDEDSKEKTESKIELLKADFPDKSLLEQLLIEIPPEYVSKRESPSPSQERVARSSVRTRSSSKMNSPADGPKTPKLSPPQPGDSPLPRNCLRSGSVDKTSPRTQPAQPVKPAPPVKRKRRESESSCASTVSCEEAASPAGRPKKKPRRDGKPPIPHNPAIVKVKKESDSDSDEPLICKVRGKGKPVKGVRMLKGGAEGVGTRRSVRHPAPQPPQPPLLQPPPLALPTPISTPVRRKTRSAVGEGATATPGAVRRRRASRDGK